MFFRPLTAIAVVLSFAVAGCEKAPEPAAATYEVEEVSIAQMSADLAAGKTTSALLTQAYVDRINKYDEALNSVIAIMPDALEQAAASDQRRSEGRSLGQMDGIPILLKDNIDAVGVPTTAGSFALEANMPAQDSEVTRRLRAAGAVILGKANTSQWAGLRTSAAFNGSTVGGSTRNPYDLTRSAGGSSNGSGIATAASLAAATVGTDTTGSIVSPSSYNGVVGMRPTIALISRRGIVPVSLTQDTAGPMTRTVTDFAMMLNVLAGTDPADPDSAEADGNKTDYVAALNANALNGAKIGVVRGTRGYGPETEMRLNEAIEVLRAQGAEVTEMPADLIEDTSQEQRIIMIHDIKEDMAAYLATAPAAVKARTLADLIAFNKADPRENMHTQDFFEAAEATNGRADAEYIAAKEYAQRRAGDGGLGRAFSEFGMQAVIGLSRGPAEVIPQDGVGGTHSAGVAEKGSQPPHLSGNAALAGYPNLSVPMGLVNDLPVGISFVGPKWSEATLISFGYAYEQASKARIPPTAYKNVAGN